MAGKPLDVLVLLREVIDPRPPARPTEEGAMIRDRGLRRLVNPADLEALEAALGLGGAAEEYAIGWAWGEAQLRIDTAPFHPGLPTFPNHLHDHEGACRADPLTVSGRGPWENLERLLEALLADPLLERVAV